MDWIVTLLQWCGAVLTTSWGTVSLIEIIWTAQAVSGLITALWGLITAQQDLTAVERHRAPNTVAQQKRELVARYSRRREGVSTYAQVALVISGVRAMWLPPNPSSTQAGALIIGLVFFTLAAALTGCSLLERLDRRRFNRLP